MSIFCCCTKRRHASRRSVKLPEQSKQGTPGVRLASLDEFGSSTPPMVTANSSDQKSSLSCHRISSSISRSPPPPRCRSNGKTMIVPLNYTNGYKRFVPLITESDNKVTTLENDIARDCSTIMEDNEDTLPISINLDKSDADFISIDRTTVSYLEPRQQRIQQCECGIPVRDKAPRFELPIPTYPPPPLPILSVRSPLFSNRRKELAAITEADNNNVEINNDAKMKQGSDNNSINSLGSPEDSSFSARSPMDTTASISDSFCVTSEEEMKSGENGQVYSHEKRIEQRIDSEIYRFSPELDCSISEPDWEHKFILDRIDEESERTANMETYDMVTSQTLDSIKSIFLHSDQKIPIHLKISRTK